MRCRCETETPLAFAMPAGTPMGGIPGKALQSAHNHGFNARVVNRARRSRLWLIVQPVRAALDKKSAAFGHSCPFHAQSDRHFCVLVAFGAGQHNPDSASACAVSRRAVIVEPRRCRMTARSSPTYAPSKSDDRRCPPRSCQEPQLFPKAGARPGISEITPVTGYPAGMPKSTLRN